MEGEEHGRDRCARMMNGGGDGYQLVFPLQGNEKDCKACGDHASLPEAPQQRSTLPELLPLVPRLEHGDAGFGVHQRRQRALISSALVSLLVIFSFLLLRTQLAPPMWITLEFSMQQQRIIGSDMPPIQQQQQVGLLAATQNSNTDLSETPQQRPPLACGNWQEDYISLHRDIMSGRVPPRFLVSVEVAAGLADRLTGILSEFYFALLTRRAFLIHHEHQPAFEEAFDAPFVNWTLPNADGDERLQQLHPEYEGNEVFLNYINVETDNATDDFYVQDLTTLPLNHSQDNVLFIASNRGRTYGLFNNPHHGDQLRAWGLTPETAFACAFNFLFRPNAATLASVQSELRDLLKDDTALKIGIKIRFNGDMVERGEDNTTMIDADPYLSCAAEVERTRKKGEQRVVWYVMSESLSLRVQIKDKYGDKVVCNTTHRIGHTNCHLFQTCNDERDTPGDRLRYSVGQIYAFSLTDVQISTRESGFGRMGAWLSKAQAGYNHTFAFYEMNKQDSKCDVTPPSQSAKTWAGV